MARALEILAVTTLALGAAHILNHVVRKRGRREQRVALQTWEAEGGAVPNLRTRTAAMQARPTFTS